MSGKVYIIFQTGDEKTVIIYSYSPKFIIENSEFKISLKDFSGVHGESLITISDFSKQNLSGAFEELAHSFADFDIKVELVPRSTKRLTLDITISEVLIFVNESLAKTYSKVAKEFMEVKFLDAEGVLDLI